MARKTIKIEIPISDPAAFTGLCTAVVTRHKNPKLTTPLNNVEKLDMAKYETKAAEAAQLQGEIDEMVRALQEKTGKRDALIGSAKGQNSQTEGTLHFMTLQIRDLLLAVNRGNENALEPWGFNVSVGEAKSPHKQAQTEAKQPAK